jgi:hypothetical protein
MTMRRIGLFGLAVLWVLTASHRLHADDAADKAQKAVEQSGGLVFRDDKADGKPIVGAFLTKDTQLKDLRGIDTCRALTLGLDCTDAALKDLKNVKNLQYLWLCWAGVTVEGLKELQKCESLQVLCFLPPMIEFRRPDVNEPAWKIQDEIERFEEARKKIDAAGQSIWEDPFLFGKLKDDSLKALQGCKCLRGLVLPTYSISDQTLRTLRSNGQLHTLWQAKAKDGKRPSSAADVVSLDLSCTRVTDDGLKELAVLQGLQELDLRFTGVTDNGLANLKEIKELQSLWLEGDFRSVFSTFIDEMKTFAANDRRNAHGLMLDGNWISPWKAEELKKSVNDLQDEVQGQRKQNQYLASLKSDEKRAVQHMGLEITDKGMKHLKGVTKLRSLYMVNTSVTADGIHELAGMKELQTFPPG